MPHKVDGEIRLAGAFAIDSSKNWTSLMVLSVSAASPHCCGQGMCQIAVNTVFSPDFPVKAGAGSCQQKRRGRKASSGHA